MYETPVMPMPYGGWNNDNDIMDIAALGLLFGGGGFGWGNRGGAAVAANDINNATLFDMLNTNMANGFTNVQQDQNFTDLLQGQFALSKDIGEQTALLQNSIYNQTTTLGQGITRTQDAVQNYGAAISGAVKDSQYANAMGLKDLQYTTQAGFYAAAAENARCCCETLRAIDGVNYNMKEGFCQTNFQNERNTSAIIQNATANAQRIVDWLSCNELKEANAKIAEQGQLLSEARIIASMKPVAPIPSYVVPSPYAPYNYGVGCGY